LSLCSELDAPTRYWRLSTGNPEEVSTEIHIVSLDCVHLFGPHAGFKDQPGDITEHRRSNSKVGGLFSEREDALLLVLLVQELHPANGITAYALALDGVVEKSAETGKLSIDRCRAQFPSRSFARRCCPLCFEPLHVFAGDSVQVGLFEECQ